MRKKEILNSIKFMKNDKNKYDEKISFIVLRKIGTATAPGDFKYSIKQLVSAIKNLY